LDECLHWRNCTVYLWRRQCTVPSTCWSIYVLSLVSGTRHKI
jgi:hypothetical protein